MILRDGRTGGRAIPRRPSAVSKGVSSLRFPLGRLPDEALLSGLATGDQELAIVFVRR